MKFEGQGRGEWRIVLAGTRPLASGVHSHGSDILRLSGWSAAADGVLARPPKPCTPTPTCSPFVAMADVFADRLQSSLAILQKDEKAGQKSGRASSSGRFVGFEAYKQLIASGVDVVLLAMPPHFRPTHLKAAVDADCTSSPRSPLPSTPPAFAP